MNESDRRTRHVDKFGSNDDLDTFVSEDINGTFTACGGDVTFWKLKKLWYFTDNHITVIIITIYRECYDIKRNVGIVYFFSTSSFVSNFVFFREIIAGFDFDENYNYIHHVIWLCHMLITRFCRTMITYI